MTRSWCRSPHLASTGASWPVQFSLPSKRLTPPGAGVATAVEPRHAWPTRFRPRWLYPERPENTIGTVMAQSRRDDRERRAAMARRTAAPVVVENHVWRLNSVTAPSAVSGRQRHRRRGQLASYNRSQAVQSPLCRRNRLTRQQNGWATRRRAVDSPRWRRLYSADERSFLLVSNVSTAKRMMR